MPRLTIGRKLWAGYFFFVGMMVLIIAIALIFNYRNRDTTIDRQRSDAFLRQITSFRTDLLDAVNNERGYIITGDDSYLGPYRDAAERFREDVEALDRLLAGPESGQAARMQVLRDLARRKVAQTAELIALRRTGGLDVARDLLRNEPSPSLLDRLRSATDELAAGERNFRTLKEAEVEPSVRIWSSVILVAFSSIFVVGALGAFFLHRTLTRRLAVLNDAARRIGEGRLDQRIEIRGDDEITELGRSFNDMASTIASQSSALVQREEQLRVIFQNAADGILTVDGNGKVHDVNPSAAILFGRDTATMVDQTASDYFSEPADLIYQILREQLGDAQGRPRELTVLRPDGNTIPVEITMQRVVLDSGALVICIMRDIRERKRVDQLKNEFVSTVSHELRTPLTSINGSLELVLGGVTGEIPSEVRSMLTIAQNNSRRLVRLINDILDIEKIESGHVAFDVRPLSAAEIARQAADANRGYAERYNVNIDIDEIDPSIRILGDSDRMQQVLANLLSNAIKFSPPHSKVSLRFLRENGQVRGEVQDSGPGIPPEFQSRIFDKFAQADASDSRQKGGTGLGLSIAKSIIERHGGTIGFITSDAGTNFHFTLPELPIAATPVPAATRPGEGPRVLVCEDDGDVATLLSMILARGGYATDVARTAAEAKSLLAQRDYAAMTLDLILPDQDGISLIRDIRLRENGPPIPIVVVSIEAAARAEEVNGDVVGIVDWIQKPIDQERLIDSIRRATFGAERKQSILHVEDDADIIRVTEMVLREIATVTPATSVAAARRHLRNDRYDLVLLDITLGDGSGLELLPLLRGGEEPTPVIIFSADEMPRDIARAVSAALVKSHTSNEMLAQTIERLIRRGRLAHLELGKTV
jgi:PAS domain S-box-containing protein